MASIGHQQTIGMIQNEPEEKDQNGARAGGLTGGRTVDTYRSLEL